MYQLGQKLRKYVFFAEKFTKNAVFYHFFGKFVVKLNATQECRTKRDCWKFWILPPAHSPISKTETKTQKGATTMTWKKFFKMIFYPHLAFILLFLPVSVAFLVFSLVFYDSTAGVSIASYLLAFYMLVVVCLRIPRMIEFCKSVKNNNKLVNKLTSDAHLRLNISLYGSLLWDGAFAIFQLGLGFGYGSIWFYSMSAYYIMLAVMRFFLLKHTLAFKANEMAEMEAKKYRLCGWLLLVMNLALAVIITLIIYWDKPFHQHEIVAITLATYTFVTLAVAIRSYIKYKKYNSPVYSSAKTITLIAACVSVLTLETTLLNTFGGETSPLFDRIILGCTGLAITVFTLTVAIIMIVKGSQRLKSLSAPASGSNLPTSTESTMPPNSPNNPKPAPQSPTNSNQELKHKNSTQAIPQATE